MSELRDKNGLTEEEFLKQYNSDGWKKPSLTADICIITKAGDVQKILLIRRGNHPCLGKWATPGGFSEEGECIENTAARELEEETSIKMDAKELTLVGVYSKPGRDPRGWTVSVAFAAVVDADKVKPIAADDAADAKWFTISKTGDTYSFSADNETITLDELAFDHADIVTDALNKVNA
ncbi:MAG: NUDIX hydrolase [Butyrivibrio sp.]|uniref:NUDIX hydrolase n=1 Tax=Butyrivibrio sp. TaxID=28121 RepID=UPI001B2839A7|nr:NUDIX hydrolase [Butyrivibrio sp.]MBO6241658.1 NUDIX hydrolase [Butyrivibrio sp.]